jgi:plasmid stabilization system protein ParE
MTFRVVLQNSARRDVEHIYDWIAARSQAGAGRWYAAFLKAASSLVESPESCGVAAEGEEIGHAIRQRFFRTRRGRIYRILFLVIEDEVRILRIRGPGQRPVGRDEITG